MEFQLNRYGYITNYLVSGLKEETFVGDGAEHDQMLWEQKMRETISASADSEPVMPTGMGDVSDLGLPWSYAYEYGNWFVDRSKFYPTLKIVRLQAAAILKVPRDMETEVWLWSYAAAGLWLNGSLVGEIDHPRYKPIQKKVLKLSLKQGENSLFIRLCNLGVRDTRTLFGIQIPGFEKEEIRVMLPGGVQWDPFRKAEEWLSSITLCQGELEYQGEAPVGSRIVYDSRPEDFEQLKNRYRVVEVTGRPQIVGSEENPWFSVEVPVGDQVLKRTFECGESLGSVYSKAVDGEDNLQRIFERIASVGRIPRGDGDSFAIYPILARFYTGQLTKTDEEWLYQSLDQIESRRDCSDFLTCGLVRLLKLYPLKPALAERCRQVMANYRYWMDEDGSDGMCFWSENHSLMFFVSAYLAGDLYPDEWFARSKKTGRELKAQAKKRIYDWMTVTLAEGFEEFHSGGYTPITFAAILNVIDFAGEPLSELAVKVADRLFEDMANQTFKGVVIAPMGRVYREVLYPFAQDIQSLVNLADDQAPDRFSEWIIFLATSSYQLPEGLKEKMEKPLSRTYEEGNAKICVERQADFMLTSVESPRRDGQSRRWESIYGKTGADRGSFEYVKALNECFHGTTQFEPGVLGYQQHLWYGALSPEAVVFVNHPGGSCESCSTRPGYWFGNGVMPALKQVKQVLYGIYQIPEDHPIPFTHVYWPQSRFQRQIREANWLAGQWGDGFLVLWCSHELEPYDDWLAGCEFRAHSQNAAYLCVCGSKKEFGTLEEFLEYGKRMRPVYHEEKGLLEAGGDSLIFHKHVNLSQYV